jgi:hypothetical protein
MIDQPKYAKPVSDLYDNQYLYYIPHVDFQGTDNLKFSISCDGQQTDTVLLRVNVVFCPDNIILSDCVGEPIPSIWGIALRDSTTEIVHQFATVLAGDIDGCGKSEVIALNKNKESNTADKILVFDDQLKLKYTIQVADTVPCFRIMPFAMADVDRCGSAEIFVLTGHLGTAKLRCYKFDGTSWAENQSFNSEKITFQSIKWGGRTYYIEPDILIGDINADGIPEIFLYNKVFNSITGATIATLPEGSSLGSYRYLKGAIPGSDAEGATLMCFPVLADVDNCGELEIVVGNEVYKVDFHTGTADLVYLAPAGPDVKDGFTSVADIDGDGFLDVAVSYNDGKQSKAYIWSPYKGKMLKQPWLVSAAGGGDMREGEISRAFIGDVDACGLPEVAFSHHLGIRCYKYFPETSSFDTLWTQITTDFSGYAPLTMFDFNQDGKTEIVYKDEKHLRIMDGETGTNRAKFPCYSGTGSEYPIVVDFSGDGHAEILASGAKDSVSHETLNIRRFSSAIPDAWAPARRVWNQYSYNAVNINDDLTVPQYQTNAAALFSGGSCTNDGKIKPYNAFLQQQTTLDRYGCPAWVLPNMQWEREPEFVYEGNSLTLSGTVVNKGFLGLKMPIYVTIYKNNTTTPNIMRLDSINANLDPGENLDVSFTVSNLDSYSDISVIIIRLNDKIGDFPYQRVCSQSENAIFYLYKYTITGKVRGLPDNTDKTISYTFGNSIWQTTKTDSDSTYTIKDLLHGSSLEIVPSPQPGYYVEPAIRIVPYLIEDLYDQDFTYHSCHEVTISGDITLCLQETNILTGFPYGGTWESSNSAVATVENGAVTGVSLGTAEIWYKVEDGECSGNTMVIVTVNSIVKPSITISVEVD